MPSAASPTSLFSCTKSPKRAPCRTRSSLDRVGDLQRRRHGRLAGLDRRRRRARFAERHRLHARLDGNWTAGRRGGDDALQPHAEPARDALGLRARIGPGLLDALRSNSSCFANENWRPPTRFAPAATAASIIAPTWSIGASLTRTSLRAMYPVIRGSRVSPGRLVS